MFKINKIKFDKSGVIGISMHVLIWRIIEIKYNAEKKFKFKDFDLLWFQEYW